VTRSPTSAHDRSVEQLIGRLLQIGVLASALVALVGGIAFLVQYGGAPVQVSQFHGQPEYLLSFAGIVRGAANFDSRAIVQLGLVMLVATPVARVALTLVAFAFRRDRMYVAITTLVLALLLYGLIWGRG
jgi:uncharacterized membrane protein